MVVLGQRHHVGRRKVIYTQSSRLTLVTLHGCRMAHRGDHTGKSQGGSLAGTRVATQSDWEEPRGGRALLLTTSPRAPRGPKT